jgi:acetyl-CoA carboxylase biotin carboxyl carrier protein
MLSDRELTYTLTFHDVIEILRLVRQSEGCTEMQFRLGDITLSVTKARTSCHKSIPEQARQTPKAPETKTDPAPDGLVKITAPVLGTFYRAPAPGAAPFVNVGDTVRESDTIGLIEVMKLFTTVTAGTAGRVVDILAENAALVEYGQPLALIEPSEPQGS